MTGGASGLGKATAARLAREGAKVAIFDLPTSKGEDTAKEIGDSCIFTPGNVTSEDDVKSALNTIKQKYDRLDVAVNCAGIGVAFKVYNFNKDLPHSLEDFTKVIMVSVVNTGSVRA